MAGAKAIWVVGVAGEVDDEVGVGVVGAGVVAAGAVVVGAGVVAVGLSGNC